MRTIATTNMASSYTGTDRTYFILTNDRSIIEYLSKFTAWREYHHRVRAFIEGSYVPLPFNLNTIAQLFNDDLRLLYERKLVNAFGFGQKMTILQLKETQDADLQQLAQFIYNKVFLNYTLKQWGLRPEELNPVVSGRVPVSITRDDRYFTDEYQLMPKHGYACMFEKMLQNDKIQLMLNTEYRQVLNVDYEKRQILLFGQPFDGNLVFTGKIDDFFNYKLGELPYRSLRFETEHLHGQDTFQGCGTVNYPNDYFYTRITEFKKLTGQQCHGTTIVREFPQAYDKNNPEANIPYYSIPQKQNEDLYRQYRHLANEWPNVHFVGRLAEYRYYDMHHVIARALHVFEKELRTRANVE